MKNFIISLLLCICIVGCKKEEIPVRQSPIVFIDEIELNVNTSTASTVFLFSDAKGNTLGCQEINYDDDIIIIPDSINQYDGYHLTLITYGSQTGIGTSYGLVTFTNIKTNKIKLKHDSWNNYDIPIRRMKAKVENTSGISYLAVQGLEIHSPRIQIDFSISANTYTYSDYYYLTAKLGNESLVRFKKIIFPNNNDEVLVDVNTMTKTDSRTTIELPNEFIEVSTVGIENCEELVAVPLGFHDHYNNKFHLYSTENLSFEKYITNVEYSGLDSLTSKRNIYSKIIKGNLSTLSVPPKLEFYIPHPEIDKFQMIIPNPNLISRTKWSSSFNASESYNWSIYGDYYGTFQAPKNFLNCIPGLELNQTSVPQLYQIVVYESSDYLNYEEFLHHHFENKLPFYLKNNCDADKDEYLIIQTADY